MSSVEYHKERMSWDPEHTVEWWGCYVIKNGLRMRFCHREDGPALKSYFCDCLEIEQYFYNDMLHRTDGPAIIRYGGGKPKNMTYVLFGEVIPEEDFNTPGFVDAFILEHS